MTPYLLLSERSAGLLFTSIWNGALLLALVAIALRLLPRMTAATRSIIWTIALLGVAGLPFLARHISSQSSQSSHALHLNPTWSIAIAAIWAVAAMFRVIELILSALRLKAIRAAAKPLPGTAKLFVSLPFGFNRTATLCTSDLVARPNVIGFFAPRVLIPGELYSKLSAVEIDQIVLHEMEHLRRGDDWRNLLQKLAVMLFPLNPALLWIERRLCLERELACDERVLTVTQAPKSYAACLVHLAEEHRFSRPLALALGAWERRSELGRRVQDILTSRSRPKISGWVSCAAVATLATGIAALGLLLAQAPQLISFTPASTAPVIAQTDTPIVTGGAHMVEARMRIQASPASTTRKIHAKFTRVTNPRRIAAAQAGQPRVLLTSWVVTEESEPTGFEAGLSAQPQPMPPVRFAVFDASGRAHIVSARTRIFSTQVAFATPGGLFVFQL